VLPPSGHRLDFSWRPRLTRRQRDEGNADVRYSQRLRSTSRTERLDSCGPLLAAAPHGALPPSHRWRWAHAGVTVGGRAIADAVLAGQARAVDLAAQALFQDERYRRSDMKGTTRVNRRRIFGALVAASAAVVGVIVPLATSANGPSPSPIPQGCQLRSPQPEAPLKLNVAAVNNLAKTIAVETEVFSCFDAQSNLAQIKNVDTTIEITERGGTGAKPTLTTVSKSIATDTCAKDLQTGRVSCKAEAMPLGVTAAPLTNCRVTRGTYPFDPVQQPTHPIEMSTVTLDDGFVKTVRVDKEVFDCSGRIGDVYLFTEVIEATQQTGFRSVRTQFEGVVCFKNETTALVTECKLFTPGSTG
jgi:hypothetical protein